jgi:flagellar basal-body rod modification protein FlgD
MTIQSASATNQYSNLTVTPKKESATPAKSTSLGQADFLKLMTTQMTHQDPSSPMTNGDFISQMAQFGTVSGIQSLQASFSSFANSITDSQALQATSLVGRKVSAPGTQGLLAAGSNITGDINLSSSSPDVKVQVTDSSTGQVVQIIDLGAQAVGSVPFTWDGKNSNGVLASPGVYKIQATANIAGANTALVTDIDSMVDSVSVGANGSGVKVNLAGGLGSINVNQIKQIL